MSCFAAFPFLNWTTSLNTYYPLCYATVGFTVNSWKLALEIVALTSRRVACRCSSCWTQVAQPVCVVIMSPVKVCVCVCPDIWQCCETATADHTKLPGEERNSTMESTFFHVSYLANTRNREGDEKVTCGLSGCCVKGKTITFERIAASERLFSLHLRWGVCVCVCVAKATHRWFHNQAKKKHTHNTWPVSQ